MTSPNESQPEPDAEPGEALWIRIVKRQIRAQEIAENLTAAMGGDADPPPLPAKTSFTL